MSDALLMPVTHVSLWAMEALGPGDVDLKQAFALLSVVMIVISAVVVVAWSVPGPLDYSLHI